jgi:hypothetical protein
MGYLINKPRLSNLIVDADLEMGSTGYRIYIAGEEVETDCILLE